MWLRRFFCWKEWLKVGIFFAACFVIWFCADQLPGRPAVWLILAVWVIGNAIFLYVPQMAVRGGKYTRENIVQAYFSGGLLLIFFGALSAGYAMQIGSVQTLPDSTINLIQIAMLACTATIGGAFCTDAILGVELDKEARQIKPTAACVLAAIFAVSALCFAIAIAGREARILDALGVITPFVLGVCVFFPWIAVSVASREYKLETAQRKPLYLLIAGVGGIASAITGVLIVREAMTAANWARGSVDFLQQLFLATSAAIGGALIARAMETNVHRFDFERWANVVVAGVFSGAKAEVKDGIITVRHAIRPTPPEGTITITIAAPLLLQLMNVTDVSRKEIAGLASDYIRGKYATDTRKHSNARDINYKLKAALLKNIRHCSIVHERSPKS